MNNLDEEINKKVMIDVNFQKIDIYRIYFLKSTTETRRNFKLYYRYFFFIDISLYFMMYLI